MQSLLRRGTITLGVLAVGANVWGFSLQGPLATWMTPRLGYDVNAAQYGGPMVIGEEYRWNVPELYYGFSPAFVEYFGNEGMAAIDKAFATLNALPAASQINLKSFPLTSQRVNHHASALGILDLRSIALGNALEQIGLCDPTRYVFTLRSRWTTSQPDTTNYYVIRRNYDPETWQTTSYINGVLWTYTQAFDIDDTRSLALTEPVDPLAYLGYLNAPTVGWWVNLIPGGFYNSLTYDDVGGLRYLYRKNNYNMESYAASVTGSGGGVWGQPPASTNATGTNVIGGTNAFVNVALRGGRERLTFHRVDYDSLLGGYFITFTNRFEDRYVSNYTEFPQTLERALVAPDIVFHVADLQGGDADSVIVSHTTTGPGFVLGNSATNAAAGGTNGIGGNLGPGTIGPGSGGPAFTFTFNGVGEILWNTYPIDNLDEVSATRIRFWGSFDGTTNPPTLFPIGISIEDVDRMVLQSDRVGNPWGPPAYSGTNTNGTGTTGTGTTP